MDRHVGDQIVLEPIEGTNEFGLRLGNGRKRYRLSRHGVHKLVEQATSSLAHHVGPDEADVIYVPRLCLGRQ